MKTFFLIMLLSSLCSASYVIPDGAVTTAKLASQAVTTAKIADASVTQAKRAALNIVTSSSSSSFSGSSGSPADITNMTVTITTTGRPVQVCLQSDGSNNSARIYVTASNDNIAADLYLVRDSSTTIAIPRLAVGFSPSSTSTTVEALAFYCYIDTPSAASHTYKWQYGISNSSTINVQNMKTIAFEL